MSKPTPKPAAPPPQQPVRKTGWLGTYLATQGRIVAYDAYGICKVVSRDEADRIHRNLAQERAPT